MYMMSSTFDTPVEQTMYSNPTNTYHPAQLQILCCKLENLSKINQVEVLRIFHTHKKDAINENKYGVHINVTDIETSVLQEVEEHLEYVTKQEKELTIIDQQQHTCEAYVLKGIKENAVVECTE